MSTYGRRGLLPGSGRTPPSPAGWPLHWHAPPHSLCQPARREENGDASASSPDPSQPWSSAAHTPLPSPPRSSASRAYPNPPRHAHHHTPSHSRVACPPMSASSMRAAEDTHHVHGSSDRQVERVESCLIFNNCLVPARQEPHSVTEAHRVPGAPCRHWSHFPGTTGYSIAPEMSKPLACKDSSQGGEQPREAPCYPSATQRCPAGQWALLRQPRP